MSAALTSRATPWPIGAATTGADRGRAARWWRGTLTATSHTIAHATCSQITHSTAASPRTTTEALRSP